MERRALGRYVTRVTGNERLFRVAPHRAVSTSKFPGRSDTMLIDGRIIEKLQAKCLRRNGFTCQIFFSLQGLQNEIVY